MLTAGANPWLGGLWGGDEVQHSDSSLAEEMVCTMYLGIGCGTAQELLGMSKLWCDSDSDSGCSDTGSSCPGDSAANDAPNW